MIRQEEIENKGITLVALVVTIIILIILAGVSINAIMGENGIITLAKKAKENIELAQVEEEQSLNQLFDDFELQESQIEGTGSYTAVLKLNEFKKKIADYIDEAANGAIDTTNEYIKPDYTSASDETFRQAIKQIVAKVTSDATATADDILEGKTAYVNGTKITGTRGNSKSFTPYSFELYKYSSFVIINNGYSTMTFKATFPNNASSTVTMYIQGSNDNSTYTTLYSKGVATSSGTSYTNQSANISGYTYLKIYANTGGNSCSITNISFT